MSSKCNGICFSEFLCLGGWEQEIPYNMLPGVTSGDDDMNSYSSNFYESGTGNRRITEYGSSNYYSEQDEEEDMVMLRAFDNISLIYKFPVLKASILIITYFYFSFLQCIQTTSR